MKKVIIITVLLMFNACATIVSDSTYPISINSNVNGAKVEVTTTKGFKVYDGQAPANLTLDAGDGFFTKAKYIVDTV